MSCAERGNFPDIRNFSSIISSVNRILSGQFALSQNNGDDKSCGISASLKPSSQSDSQYQVLQLWLSGAPLDKVLKNYSDNDNQGYLIRWLIPEFKDSACLLADLTDEARPSYCAPAVYRRDIFDKDFRQSAAKSDKAKTSQPLSPLNYCVDLDRPDGLIYPSSWWRYCERLWHRFYKTVKEKGTSGESVLFDALVKLEAGLNAVWTSGRARARAHLEPLGDKNILKQIETSRQVIVDWKPRTLGRLRIPHGSHKGRLCPFQTPESERTGLNLQLTADASLGGNGKVKQGTRLFSAAVGMVPYPFNTDGPRLMMGGKNMKQAEPGIHGAEPTLVPGYCEGIGDRHGDRLEAFRDHVDENGRLTPPIGLNALTVIMPFEGFTYEDGLVISRSLARRFDIDEDEYVYSKVIRAVLIKDEVANAIGVKATELRPEMILSYLKNLWEQKCGTHFVYGDKLPDFGLRLYEDDMAPDPVSATEESDTAESPSSDEAVFVNSANKEQPEFTLKHWHEIYAHHAPGTLKNVSFNRFSLRGHDTYYRADIIIKWSYSVCRPTEIGDKITGRNGNKGVVTQIIDDEKMPRVHFGKELGGPQFAELIISPSSIMGRKNLGQIWEMLHSLLIKANKTSVINQELITRDNECRQEACAALKELGADARGMFKVTYGKEENIRAFAGWQYFCRLHHHARKKLQARGKYAPNERTTGQPMRCGSQTGQRMGEMENWSLLSHGAQKTLFAMRENQCGDYEKTRTLFADILRSLGIEENQSGSTLNFAFEVDESGERTTLQRLLGNYGMLRKGKIYSVCWSMGKNKEFVSMKEHVEKILDECDLYNDEDDKGKKEFIEGFRKRMKDSPFFDKKGNLYVNADLLEYKRDLRKELSKFERDKQGYSQLKHLDDYLKMLEKLLSSKKGIPRKFMLGRRYNHSGRAVIVPAPSLNVDEVYLPAAMLVELLDGYDKDYRRFLPDTLRNTAEIRRELNIWTCNNENTEQSAEVKKAASLAEQYDKFLQSNIGELWCLMIRQPSLHRHSVQAFRVRCWEHSVIGLPPFVTPGFGADFDGDTMAVFLPPYSARKDLRRCSILNNPGIVGDGSLAFATSLDLALGWYKMPDKQRKHWYEELAILGPSDSDFEPLKKYLPKLLKKFESASQTRTELRRLQQELCACSTGAASLAPGEFEILCQELENSLGASNLLCKGDLPFDLQTVKVALNGADEEIKKLLSEPERKEWGLNIMLKADAKGSASDIRQMTWAIGIVECMTDEDNAEGRKEEKFIPDCFWKGLSPDKMFVYSYPSRYSMAQKKLSVADAGYFSRQMAEGLFEITVEGEDCGTNEGIQISYDRNLKRLTVEGMQLPTKGSIRADLERAAWGRVPAGMKDCLSGTDLDALNAYFIASAPTEEKPFDEQAANEARLSDELREHLRVHQGKLVVRSPLYCHEKENGHVCAHCYGADIASKPYDHYDNTSRPVCIAEGACVGLTAAQAIGERGTQLAMKRFHAVAGEASSGESVISKMRGILYTRKDEHSLTELFGHYEGNDAEKHVKRGILADAEKNGALIAAKELPQALIHYELALAVPQPPSKLAENAEGCFLSAIAHEKISSLIESGGNKIDSLNSIKSRLVWEGGKKADGSDTKNNN